MFFKKNIALGLRDIYRSSIFASAFERYTI